MSEFQTADICAKSLLSGDKFAPASPLVGIHSESHDATHRSCSQPHVALPFDAALPTVRSALPAEMPAPIATTTGSSGSQGSAGRQHEVQNFVVHSDDDAGAMDRNTVVHSVANTR